MPHRSTERSLIAFASEIRTPLASTCKTLPLQEFAMPSYNQSTANVRSLPPENNIVGLWTPFSTDDHGAVQFGLPVICQEEVTNQDNWSLAVTASECDLFDHEEADFNKVEKSVVHHQSWQKKPKKKFRKRRKIKKRGQFGSQRGKGKQSACDSNGPQNSEQPVARQVNCPVNGDQPRINQPTVAGDGDDSGSDEENGGQRDLSRGHYAGIADEDEDDDEIDDVPISSVPSPSSLDQKREQELSQRFWDFRIEVNNYIWSVAKQVKRLIIHIAHKSSASCRNCREELCRPIRSIVEHFIREGNCGCGDKCRMVELGLFLHAAECDSSICNVPDCKFWKAWLQVRHKRRHLQGKIIHSTTTLFQENSHVSEDVDYAFLQKFHLGRGTFGDAWRVWFYSITRQCEADIVVKEAKYDLEDEAKIHGVIRQNHPNLLGAMAILKFDKPRRVMKNKMEDIYGYVFMERAECTLYERKEQFRVLGCRGIPIRDAFYYQYQILDGLRFLHANGIVHKDVKDQNVLMFNHGQLVKLSDWDAAIFVRDEFERGKTAGMDRKGTPGFCANEVYKQECHGFPADIFSAAAMLLEIVYGGVYRQKGEKGLELCGKRRQAALEELTKEHPELGDLMEKCLSQYPERRPTARELVENDLLKFEQDFRVEAVEPQPPPPCKEFRYWPDACSSVRHKLDEIKEKTPEDVLRMMDALDKVLPSENIPQSSTWEVQVQEESLGFPVEATEDDYPESMDVG